MQNLRRPVPAVYYRRRPKGVNMIVNVGKDGEPLNIVGYVVSGKQAAQIYKLIGQIDGGLSNERKNESAKEPRGVATTQS